MSSQLRVVLVVAALALRMRRGVLGVLGLVALGMGALVGALWPPLEDTFTDISDDLLDTLSTALSGSDLATPAGWVNAELLSIVAPAMVIAAAVLVVVRALPEAEQSGRLGLLAALPVRRGAYLAGVTLAALVAVVSVAVAVCLAIVLADPLGGLGLDAEGIVAVGLHLAALGACFTGVALLAGALSAQARVTAAVTAGLAVLSFAMTVFLPLSDDLADAAQASPWHYYNSGDPLTAGADPVHLAVLVGIGLAATLLAVATLHRRDLA